MRTHLTLTFAAICACVCAAAPRDGRDTVVTRQQLDTVVVRAASAPRQVTSSAPLHTLSSDRLKLTGVSDIADAMHRLPGITLRDYGGAGGLKTVSVRGFGASHTGVVYDGIPLGDCQSGQIDLSRYSLDNVAALAMSIGDNDDIFVPARVAASAASLAISTLGSRPDTTSVTAQLRVGAWDFVNPFVNVASPLGSRVAVSVSGEYTHAGNDYPFTLFNGQTSTRERRHNTRMNSGHGEFNLMLRPTGRSTLDIKAYYYDNSRRLPGPVIYYNPVTHERLRETNAFGQASYRTPLGSRWSLRAAAKFDFSRSLYSDTDGKYPGGELRQNYWQREAYATATLLWLPAKGWSMAYAADYAYNNLTSNLPDDIRPFRNTLLQSLTARWRSGRLTAMARLLNSNILNSARRGDASRDARRLSPSASVSFRILRREELYLRLSYKEIFRAPTFNEAYFDHYGSKDLKPETTRQVNLGLTWSTGARGFLSAATVTADGYVNRISDMIVGIPYNMFVWRMVNLDKVTVTGLDVTANIAASLARRQALTLAGNYSYQRARTRTDRASSEWNKQVAYIPEHSGTVSLSYTSPWVNAAWHTTAVSTRYATNNNLPASRIAPYSESGVTLWRQFPLRRRHSIEIRADILNIFDKQYEVVARYPMPGRSWQLTLKYHL